MSNLLFGNRPGPREFSAQFGPARSQMAEISTTAEGSLPPLRHGCARLRTDRRKHVARRGVPRGQVPRQKVHHSLHPLQRVAFQAGPLRLGAARHQIRPGRRWCPQARVRTAIFVQV